MIILLDNGSKRANAVLALRALALRLAGRLECFVEPVSLAHADGIAPEHLEGASAQVFSEFIEQAIGAGQRDFTVLPLFFGQSDALSSVLAQKIEQVQEAVEDCRFSIAETLVPLPQGEPKMTEILHDQLSLIGRGWAGKPSHVILTDHGTPSTKVNDVRRWLADALASILPAAEVALLQAVMERREGAQYDFNGQTLERVLETLGQLNRPLNIVVAMLFLLPGRHAGAGGDIDEICRTAQLNYPFLDIRVTPLVSEHPYIIDVLEARYLATR